MPFRVVHYGQNLGFAGANNVGAQLARAPLLLLLNSDVIPTAHGWISDAGARLCSRFPAAGAVGPLLLFADGSVQHAGMRPLVDPALPGFIWNSHPGKGAPWRGGTEPISADAADRCLPDAAEPPITARSAASTRAIWSATSRTPISV